MKKYILLPILAVVFSCTKKEDNSPVNRQVEYRVNSTNPTAKFKVGYLDNAQLQFVEDSITSGWRKTYVMSRGHSAMVVAQSLNQVDSAFVMIRVDGVVVAETHGLPSALADYALLN
jgi:hypothetical protein